jgi:hypothetical protein
MAAVAEKRASPITFVLLMDSKEMIVAEKTKITPQWIFESVTITVKTNRIM